MRTSNRGVLAGVWSVVLAGVLVGVGAGVAHAAWASGESAAETGRRDETKVLQLPIRTDGPKTLDPVQGSTTYDNMASVQIYETLLENQYANPRLVEPRLLAEMPTSPDEGLTWRFRLKPGVLFVDPSSPGCFAGGAQTREVTTDDVFYSLKRIADKKNQLKNWWLVEGTIEGFDAFKEEQNKALRFDYDAPVSGFVKISDTEFEIRLTKPVYRFLYVLSMFQTSIVPREAVEKYGADFGVKHAVGTGAFVLDSFTPKQALTLNRNEKYHEVLYPDRDQWTREDRRLGLHQAAGQRVPFVDRVEFTMFVEDQPMWLQFEAGKIAYTEVPAEYFEQAFDKRTRTLRAEYAERGVTGHSDMLLDFIFRAFNMEDPVVGAPAGERGKLLRQAVQLAIDLNEFNEAFYNGLNVVYDGPIPPGLDGHPEGGRAPAGLRGPNLELARQKLAEAGYTVRDGKAVDAPTLEFFTSRGGNNQEQSEMLKRQLAEVGITVRANLVDFSTLIQNVDNKKAQFFGFAWSSDYPDGENNLALFYGPNRAPGSNHSNYQNPEYDALYEQIVKMGPSAERTAIYEKMRDMVIEDVPFTGAMARERFYLSQPWALNLRPTERYWSWFKYVDVDDSKR
jgi:ABC-type transport system substrate-binding protein